MFFFGGQNLANLKLGFIIICFPYQALFYFEYQT